MGEGFDRDGRACVRLRVCLSTATYSVWAGVCETPGDFTHAHGETCQLTAFDYCRCWCLLFACFCFFVVFLLFHEFCHNEVMEEGNDGSLHMMSHWGKAV